MKYSSWLFGRDGALFSAAARGKEDLLQELIADGANVNAASGNGYTPLHRAAQNGHEHIVRRLVQQGANVQVLSIDNLSPSDLARKNGHMTIVNLLAGSA